MQAAYQEVAERSLSAAKYLLEQQIYEMAGFCCYHAYESSASALAVNYSKPHGKNAPNHRRKLQILLECVQGIGNNEIQNRVRQLNLSLGGIRDNLLYPVEELGVIAFPKDYLSREQLEELIEEVEIIVKWIGEQISNSQLS